MQKEIIYKLTIDTFVYQKFCQFFFKPSLNVTVEEPKIKFHQLLSFASFLNVCCQFVPSVMPGCRLNYEEKCKN